MKDRVGANGKTKKTNLTDGDSSSMMSGAGGASQGYMAVAVSDPKHQVITAADIAEESEQASFIPIMESVEDNLGISLEDTQVLADAGFNTITNVNYCDERGIDAYIADKDMRGRNPLYHNQCDKKPASRKQKYFKASDFRYDEETNSCQCPAGKLMWLASDDYILNGEHYRRFVGYLDHCRVCPFQSQCMRKTPKEQGRQVSIKKGVEFNEPRPLDLMKEKVDSKDGRDRYSARMGMIEPVFAHIKHNLGLRRLSLRGLDKVRGQWLLFCTVYNLGKIQRYGEYEPI